MREAVCKRLLFITISTLTLRLLSILYPAQHGSFLCSWLSCTSQIFAFFSKAPSSLKGGWHEKFLIFLLAIFEPWVKL